MRAASVAAVAVVVAGAGVVGVPGVAGAVGAHRSASGEAHAAGVPVALVVDFGVRSGITPEVVVRCLRVAPGANGSAVLADLSASLHLAAPTYGPSGLLCSIDGYPAHGCGTAVSGGYEYWSYWHGGSRWSYASVGPAEWTVRAGDVEGWRFENPGAATPSDPPPKAAPGYAAACAHETAAPTGAPRPVRTTSGWVLFGIAGVLVVGLVGSSAARWRRRVER